MIEFILICNRVASVFTATMLNTAAVTLAAVIVVALMARSKGWSASTRCLLWWLTLAFVVAAPLSSLIIPPNRHQVVRVTRIATSASGDAPVVRLAHLNASSSPRLSVAGMVLLCWCLAASWQLLRLTRGFACALNMRRGSEPYSESLQALFRLVSKQARIQRNVTLGVCLDISSPIVLGYASPRILIPRNLASQLDATELEQIFLHELAHVERYDDWAIVFQRLLEAVLIFHPLVWFLGKRLNLDREMACDDFVASVYEPKHYASCLAKVAEMNFFAAENAVALPLMERRSELLARVETLLDASRVHLTIVSSKRLLLASAILFALGVLDSELRS